MSQFSWIDYPVSPELSAIAHDLIVSGGAWVHTPAMTVVFDFSRSQFR
ncbi:hypothetical protein [Rhodococcus sp. T2V]|nr:hypothetical protein [Rhodococcus sp. T2V]